MHIRDGDAAMKGAVQKKANQDNNCVMLPITGFPKTPKKA